LEHVVDLDPLLQIFSKILSPKGQMIISGPTENSLYVLARKIANLGSKGNLKGSEEHVRNIFDIRNKILNAGFIIQQDKNLWNLFHVMSFKVRK